MCWGWGYRSRRAAASPRCSPALRRRRTAPRRTPPDTVRRWIEGQAADRRAAGGAALAGNDLVRVPVAVERARVTAPGWRVEALADVQAERLVVGLGVGTLVAGPAEVLDVAVEPGWRSRSISSMLASPRRRSRARRDRTTKRNGLRRPVGDDAAGVGVGADRQGVAGQPVAGVGSTRRIVPSSVPRLARRAGGGSGAQARRPRRWAASGCPRRRRRVAAGVAAELPVVGLSNSWRPRRR